ncbi:MAG: ATP-dependent protease, Lon family [Sulfobacillus thermosulfidooxidans]|uniref:endopeptidase La n=1 Tax=Sulfobacillus thermotolerans TaxID=338644 RepID=A0ABM6RMN4_9FIRM|nr:Lon family ATP-dependent protease [Sulfobacillus sp. hq2]AUW92594.1 ATP-dependent protease, Lon family [Sulfobacillus thermotolerans]MCY0909015.1 Lon family ATP-dependent protease [Sulfobacillus thermotolerans]POB12086.1 ATP-dependent protease, Lon family [Sulfobacillus sp. hq2]PSR37800.1 MAG: ATP-dependent protease, Lon family [Sulfobacillus thermosulfidooxidans]
MEDNIKDQEPKAKKRANTLERRVAALHDILMQIYGPERLILRAGKLQALKYLRSDDIGLRALALAKLVREDPSLNEVPTRKEIGPLLNDLEDELADILARRTLEDDLEKRIAEKMQEKHEDYVRDIRNQILKEDVGPESPETLKKFAALVKLDEGGLTQSALEVMRPSRLDEVIGQEDAIDSLLAKLASPYPQHVLLYGPPGVGKTTVARLVLAVARKLPQSPFSEEAPFVEADGTTLRWDPREITNPLLGSVHDPIYQGARRDLAESGIPEPKTGLVTDSHGGVLFIDEIGEMDPILQNKLLKVLEDKRVYFDSPYYDPLDPNVPKYVHKLFAEGAPADFILIGATTRSPEDISPALRSRCAEIYFEPLTPKDIARIVMQAAEKLQVRIDDGAVDLVGQYTLEGRKAVGLVADAFSVAYLRMNKRPDVITPEVMKDVISRSRLIPVKPPVIKEPMIGRSLGLAVAGYQGMVLEIEATVFPTLKEGEGRWRFNDTAGSMAKDSVFNAATVLRQLTGRDLTQYDVHVNVVGGGNIDGPSAGVAIFAAVYSALTQRPIRSTVAMTGELSLTGRVKPVGGIPEKIFGARQIGLTTVLVPEDNAGDVPPGIRDMRIILVKTVEDVLTEVLV